MVPYLATPKWSSRLAVSAINQDRQSDGLPFERGSRQKFLTIPDKISSHMFVLMRERIFAHRPETRINTGFERIWIKDRDAEKYLAKEDVARSNRVTRSTSTLMWPYVGLWFLLKCDSPGHGEAAQSRARISTNARIFIGWLSSGTANEILSAWKPMILSRRYRSFQNGGCQPASAQSCPLTSELAIKKQIASAISDGSISRPSRV